MSEQLQDEYIKLIQGHVGIIHKVIGLYVEQEEDKKDLHQEILLQAWKSFGNFKGNSSFSTWLYKVALNTVLTFHKKKKPTDDISKIPEIASSPDKQEDHEVLYHIIKSLDEIDRMLITLHLDGYKNLEIAEITGMTQNHINVKIHRVKNKIIETFKRINNG